MTRNPRTDPRPGDALVDNLAPGPHVVQHVADDGAVTELKAGIKVLPGEIVDATFLSAKALDAFLAETIATAKAENLLYSVHLKATMMKVSDPILFGHAVRVFFKDLFTKHGATFAELVGISPSHLRNVENGHRTVTQHLAEQIAAVLATAPDRYQPPREPRPETRHRGR